MWHAKNLERGTTPTHPGGGGGGPGTCTVAAWAGGTVYNSGAEVSLKGRVWRAKWWTQDQEPGPTAGEWGVWQDVRAC
ncbi:carbohydrate-binding protein [Streptomyces sp. NBC_01808]|uniref:carbohydrate-binding protein n=1 Tax=Streptomyces sp. NBC_01808 TaxID=2975947 RepID=UPI003FA3B5A1